MVVVVVVVCVVVVCVVVVLLVVSEILSDDLGTIFGFCVILALLISDPAAGVALSDFPDFSFFSSSCLKLNITASNSRTVIRRLKAKLQIKLPLSLSRFFSDLYLSRLVC